MLYKKSNKEKWAGEEGNTHLWAANHGDGGCKEFRGVAPGLLNALGRHVISNRITDILSSICNNHQLLLR